MPYILPYVPGCSEPLAKQALVESAIAFCEDTDAIKQPFDTVALLSGQSSVELDVNAGSQVARVLVVVCDGRALHPVLTGLDAQFAASQNQPSHFTTRRTDSEFTLVVHPTPDKQVSLSGEFSLRPRRDATTLEDDLFSLHLDPVVQGALSRICAVPNQPFSDMGMSVRYQSEAIRLSRNHRVAAFYGRARGGARVQQRPFA